MKVKITAGCNYPPNNTRAEPGDVIDVPEDIAKALIRADAAKPVKEKQAPQTAPGGGGNSGSTGTTDSDAPEAPTGGEG